MALTGATGAVLLVACLLPLLWPVAELAGADPIDSAVVLADANLWRLLARTLMVTVAVLLATLAIGLPMAILVARTDVAGRGAALIAHAFPACLPPLLPALGWFHLVGREGLIGNTTSAALLFSDAGVALVLGLVYAPIVTALTALALWNAEPSREEAARVVAAPLKVAVCILLPAARPAIALACVIVAALTLSEVGVPMFLRDRTYAAAIFARLGGIDYAPAEALLLTLPVLTLALTLLVVEQRATGGRSFAVMGLRSFRTPPMALQAWRSPATILCWSIALLSLAPVAALAWRAGYEGFAALPLWIGDGVRNSLLPAGAAASVITLLAVVIGHGRARQARAAAPLDAIALLAFVAPAALLGVGLIALWNRAETAWLYGSWAIIAAGYIGRYAIVGIRAFATACAQAPSQIEDAARVFGAGYATRLARIVVPLHARALIGAWLLTLVFCLRDLETAVIFYPPGREPLTVRIFTLEANGPEDVVAALACLQVAITAATVALALPLLTMRAGR